MFPTWILCYFTSMRSELSSATTDLHKFKFERDIVDRRKITLASCVDYQKPGNIIRSSLISDEPYTSIKEK